MADQEENQLLCHSNVNHFPFKTPCLLSSSIWGDIETIKQYLSDPKLPLKTGRLPRLGNLYAKCCNKKRIDFIWLCNRSYLLISARMATYPNENIFGPGEGNLPSRAEQAHTLCLQSKFSSSLRPCLLFPLFPCSSSSPHSSYSPSGRIVTKIFTRSAINMGWGESNKPIYPFGTEKQIERGTVPFSN